MSDKTQNLNHCLFASYIKNVFAYGSIVSVLVQDKKMC